MTLVTTSMPTTQELLVYQTWAKSAFDSQMYRTIGKESAIMMIMLAAREYGIGPAQALNGGLHIIEGKVELSARMMSALIRRAKHSLQIIESNDSVCTIKGKRADTGEEHIVTYTIEEAREAGLIKEKSAWKKTPIDMLYARAISRLARQLFSDVVGIGYVEGEISQPEASKEELEPSYEYGSHPIEQYLESFEKENHCLAITFLDEIAEHYSWPKERAIQECLKNPEETKTRFEKWKERVVTS